MLRSSSSVDGMPMEDNAGEKGRRRSCPSGPTPVDSTIFIKQPYTQVAFDEIYLKEQNTDKPPLFQRAKEKVSCTPKKVFKVLSDFLPIIKTVRYYNLKENAVVDILSGITIGILHIPQALAFGLLTSVKVENGLYTSVWPIILYVIFGTSPHVSMGTSAVICIVTASVVDKQADVFKAANVDLRLSYVNGSLNASLPEWESIPEFMDYKEHVSMTIALFVGVILLAMGFMRLGFITAYLSESFFAAFTSGAAVHIATSQIPPLLGISIPRYGGAFKIVKTYTAIFENITEVNVAAIITTIICIAFIFLIKECINERFKDKLFIPIPVELLVVIIATLVSYLGKLNEEFGLAIVGNIPSTIPPPVLPDTTGVQDYFVDCFVIAILIFANTIAMAKVCAKKHNYEVDDSQELIAYGMCNFVSAFLKCFPSAVAPPRSMVASNMNAKSTINGIFAALLMILVIMAMSILFEPLPKAALASIIVAALKGLFIQIGDCRKFWRINKIDFVIWFSTIVSVVFLDIDFGLGIGVIVSLITVVFQTQFARGFRLGRITKDGAIVEYKRYTESVEDTGVKVFRFQSNLFFANAEIFRNTLYRCTVNPRKLLKFLKKQERKGGNKEKKVSTDMTGVTVTSERKVSQVSINSNGKNSSTTNLNKSDNPVFSISDENISRSSNYPGNGSYQGMPRQMSTASSLSQIGYEEDPETGDELVTPEKIRIMRKTHHIIIDCSNINYLDASGANVLGHIYSEYDHVKIKVFLAGCSVDMIKTMMQAGIFDKIPKGNLFLTLYDAIAVAKTQSIRPLPPVVEDYDDEEAAEDSYITNIQ
ncbi:sulfate transporter-like [Ostrea edulis]|uniref:sulfate transporter-like n=1 Tax=Ostrea edulis TaxID=37623 RepID=UPI0024AF30AF|nr:sulfate transporter-like [Ostrea edulis]